MKIMSAIVISFVSIQVFGGGLSATGVSCSKAVLQNESNLVNMFNRGRPAKISELLGKWVEVCYQGFGYSSIEKDVQCSCPNKTKPEDNWILEIKRGTKNNKRGSVEVSSRENGAPYNQSDGGKIASNNLLTFSHDQGGDSTPQFYCRITDGSLVCLDRTAYNWAVRFERY